MLRGGFSAALSIALLSCAGPVPASLEPAPVPTSLHAAERPDQHLELQRASPVGSGAPRTPEPAASGATTECLRRGDEARARGDDVDAREFYNSCVRQYAAGGYAPGSPEADVAGRAQLELAHAFLDDLRALAVDTRSGDRHVRSLVNQLYRVSYSMKSARAYVSPYWIVATLVTEAQAYDEAALKVLQLPVSDDAAELQRLGLKRADDYRKGAAELYQKALDTAHAADIDSHWSRKARTKLELLQIESANLGR